MSYEHFQLWYAILSYKYTFGFCCLVVESTHSCLVVERQFEFRAPSILWPQSVSYTHLDVYKRQA